jgi:hypothetical protein
MGVMRGYTLRDKRGRNFEANVADSVNIDRTPRVREQILAGEFHRIPDRETGGRISVEKTFFYTDFSRGQFFLVLPRWDRHKWQEATFELRGMLRHLPESLAPKDRRSVRVVFGLAELREKLLAFDAGIDDGLVEAVKAVLLAEHPFLLQHPRLNIVLDRADNEAVEFVCSYDHHPRKYRIGYPRQKVDLLLSHGGELDQVVMDLRQEIADVDKEESFWVNLRRFSPNVWAVSELDRKARQIEAGDQAGVNLNSDAFDFMLRNLPQGSELSAAAKRDLEVLGKWAGDQRKRDRASVSLTEELAEIYLGKKLTGEWGAIKPALVRRIWTLLANLDDGDVEGNSFVDEIRLGVPGEDSSYDPQTRDIGIDRTDMPRGRAYDNQWFERVVLHEVGHAVHAQHKEVVDAWLAKRFGWARFTMSVADINQWITALGGYPGDAGSREQEQIRAFIRQSVGNGGRWTAPARPRAPKEHPWSQEDFAVRLACELTTQRTKGKRWYSCYDRWYQQQDRRFFINYYYRELMIVGDPAIDLVRKKALSAYGLMAAPEFFAELYATVHGRDRRQSKRKEKLDQDILDFFQALSQAQPSQNRPGSAPPSGGYQEHQGPTGKPILTR